MVITDRYADVTNYDVTRTDENLTINSEYVVSFRMAAKDNFQASPKLIADEAENQAQILSDQIDSDVLGEIFNAASTVDDGSIGGTAGNGITLAEANVYKIPNAVTEPSSTVDAALKISPSTSESIWSERICA